MHHRSHDQHLGDNLPLGGRGKGGDLSLVGGGFTSTGEGSAQPTPELGKRAVRILLECFLVILMYFILLLQARHLCFFFDYAALSLYSLGVAIAYKAYLFPRELIGTR